eukprot:1690107-Karenia_brevis.AAC.1
MGGMSDSRLMSSSSEHLKYPSKQNSIIMAAIFAYDCNRVGKGCVSIATHMSITCCHVIGLRGTSGDATFQPLSA